MRHKIRLQIVEIEAKNVHLFVEIKVGDKPCRMLVDTGASKTVFDAKHVLKYVKETKIKQHESKSVGLGVSEMETKVVKLKKLQIGQLTIKQLEVAILDLAHVNATYKGIKLPEIDGVMGGDLLMKYQAVIHYGKSYLKLQD